MGRWVKLFLCIAVATSGCKPTKSASIKPASRVCGMTYSHIWTGHELQNGFSPRSEDSLAELAALGMKRIAFTPHGWLDSLKATEIKEHPAELKNAYLAQVRQDAIQARRHGMKILIKPHVIVLSKKWVARAKPDHKQGGWPAWFKSYERFILSYARFAEEIGARWLSLGVELNSAVTQNPHRWRALIGKARHLFSGKLTYTATFDQAEKVTFWGDLDVVSVALFGNLAHRETYSQAELNRNALKWLQRLTRIAGIYKRPLMLTEVGYINREGTAKDPWKWPENLDNPRRTAEGDAQQAMAYRSIITVFGQSPQVEAIFWWKWFDDPSYLETPQLVGFSPRNKPAAKLLQAACLP